MISDSSFWLSIKYPYWGIFLYFSPRFLVVVGWYPYWGIFPSPWWDCVWATVHRWMIIVGCLPHDFDIIYYTGAYSSLLDEIVFGQRYIDGWSLLVVYLMTSTLDIISGHIFLHLMRSCLCSSMRMNDRCWLFISWLWHQILYWGIFPHFLWVSLRLRQGPAWF